MLIGIKNLFLTKTNKDNNNNQTQNPKYHMEKYHFFWPIKPNLDINNIILIKPKNIAHYLNLKTYGTWVQSRN